ncbi:MAG: hypothetical protein K2F78_01720 [Muribaculaceae bacterium]|nr:hypothetical protein [Muribaculaceae bacterium]
MNKQRRMELGEVSDLLDEATSRLEEIRYEEQDAFDNMPEGLQNSSRGDAMVEAMDAMDEIMSDIEDVKNKISELTAN